MSTPTEISIGNTLEDTLQNLIAAMDDPSVTFTLIEETNTIAVTYNATGTVGNFYALATNVVGATTSSSTLLHGKDPSADGHFTRNGFFLTKSILQFKVLPDSANLVFTTTIPDPKVTFLSYGRMPASNAIVVTGLTPRAQLFVVLPALVPTVASLALTASTPVETWPNWSRVPTVASLALSLTTPVIAHGTKLAPAVAALALSTNLPVRTIGISTRVPAAASLTLSATTPVTAVTTAVVPLSYTTPTDYALLLHLDSNFTDATGRHIVTPQGAVSIDNSQYKFGGASAFSSSSDYLSLDGSTDFAFGTGDFTVDFWMRLSSLGGSTLSPIDFSAANGNPAIQILPNGTIQYYAAGAAQITSSSGAISINTWYHVATTRYGGTTRLFLNGTVIGTNYIAADNFTNVATYPIIGSNVPGWTDEIRVVKGRAAWISNFTPPVAAYDNYFSLSLTANTPARSRFFVSSSVSLNLVANTPVSTLNIPIVPTVASLALSANVPARTIAVVPAVANIILSVNTPSVAQALQPAAANVALSANTPIITRSLNPAAASVVLFANTPIINTYVLLHMDGTNGSTTFLDATGRHTTLVDLGTVTVDTSHNVFGNASARFSNNSQLAIQLNRGDWAFGAGDFTIDAWWFLPTSVFAGGGGEFIQWDSGANTQSPFMSVDHTGSVNWVLGDTLTVLFQSAAGVIPANTWFHIALVRVSGIGQMFINGISIGTFTDTTNYSIAEVDPYLGPLFPGTGNFTWVDEFRMIKGYAAWTSNFTVPSQPYTP